MSDDGRSEHFLTQSNADATSASWAPDGARISYTDRKPEYFSGKLEVVKFDPRTGQADDPATLYTSPDGSRRQLVGSERTESSPDSRTLAVALQDSGWDNVYLLSASGAAPEKAHFGALTKTPRPGLLAQRCRCAGDTSVESARLSEETGIWLAPVDVVRHRAN